MTIQWFPGHMTRARRQIQEKLKQIDAVIELLDARVPHSSRNPMIDEILRGKPRLVLLNKADLADQRATDRWIAAFREDGLDSLAVDAAGGQGIKEISARVKKLVAPQWERMAARGVVKPRAVRVLIVGIPNVGKSTLINRLIRDYSDLDRELTVSRYPGTTLDQIRIPLDDGRYIIDTPGIVYPYRLTETVPKGVLQRLLPEKPLKPLVYQLNERQTLFFGALARFDFVRGEPQSFTLYVSPSLYVHRTKLERADEVYAEHKGELLAPPNADELDAISPWTRHSLRIPPGSRTDISISGLGWIRANSPAGAFVEVYAPKGVHVILREAMI